MSKSYPASATSVPAIRHAIASLLGATNLDPQRTADVLLAVSEAATSAVVHGCATPTDRIDLEAELQSGSLIVTMRDYGHGIVLDAPPTSPGLRLGLPLIFALADHAELRHAHTGTRGPLHFTIRPRPVRPAGYRQALQRSGTTKRSDWLPAERAQRVIPRVAHRYAAIVWHHEVERAPWRCPGGATTTTRSDGFPVRLRTSRTPIGELGAVERVGVGSG